MISKFIFQALYRFFVPVRVPEDSDSDDSDSDSDLEDVLVDNGGPPGAGGGGANVRLTPGAARGNVKAPKPQVTNLGSCWTLMCAGILICYFMMSNIPLFFRFRGVLVRCQGVGVPSPSVRAGAVAIVRLLATWPPPSPSAIPVLETSPLVLEVFS